MHLDPGLRHALAEVFQMVGIGAVMHVEHRVIGIGRDRDVDPDDRLVELLVDGLDEVLEPLAGRAHAKRADDRDAPGEGPRPPGHAIQGTRESRHPFGTGRGRVQHDMIVEFGAPHVLDRIVRLDFQHDGKLLSLQEPDPLRGKVGSHRCGMIVQYPEIVVGRDVVRPVGRLVQSELRMPPEMLAIDLVEGDVVERVFAGVFEAVVHHPAALEDAADRWLGVEERATQLRLDLPILGRCRYGGSGRS